MLLARWITAGKLNGLCKGGEVVCRLLRGAVLWLQTGISISQTAAWNIGCILFQGLSAHLE